MCETRGSYVAAVGGNWNNGLKAGLFYWNLNNSSSNANTNIGSRQLILTFIFLLHIIFLTTW